MMAATFSKPSLAYLFYVEYRVPSMISYHDLKPNRSISQAASMPSAYSFRLTFLHTCIACTLLFPVVR